MGHVSASPRLAAHQSGRAIAAVSSKVDRITCGVKYVATVSTVSIRVGLQLVLLNDISPERRRVNR